ncbi:trans-3-hydroxy-L-proline dehydratase [Ambystoma mexicanum]|uniref:trans-3-hydroxy-L-proline dehydratase n=1 Tax=Ambystoma mexicanum TaxID=8296 RepID=UPI0037E74514
MASAAVVAAVAARAAQVAQSLTLPPHDGQVLSVVDMHTGGEPVRILISGLPQIRGSTLLTKRRYVSDSMDSVRCVLMWEPRGHRDMYGVLLVESELPEAHFGVLFMHNEGYSTMCGHAVIALARFAVDQKLVTEPTSPETQVNLHCPCGLVTAYVEYENGKTGRSRFHSVPAFVFATDVTIYIKEYGKVNIDVAYGGGFYAFVNSKRFGLDVCNSKTRDLVDAATAVTEAIKGKVKLHHPDSEDLAFLYGTIFTDGNDAYSAEPTANLCVFADAQVDRSPTGSGVTARIALQFQKGQIALNQMRTFKSGATNALFTGKAIKETKCGEFNAVIVEVAGNAYYTGASHFLIEKGDPLKNGFLLK